MDRTIYGITIKWLIIIALAVAAVAWVSARFLFNKSGEVRQAQTETRSAEAMQAAGQVAVAVVLDQTKEEVALKDLVAEASKEIDNAPNPAAARAATLGAACQLRLYRDDPACQLRPADPARVGGGSGRPPAP